MQTAPDEDLTRLRFRVTHPFLPQRGEEYEVLERRLQWGINVVIYREEPGQPRRFIPVAWTDLAEPDPWGDSSGRSPFRWPDLLRLAELVRELGCQEDFAGGDKRILPNQGSSPTRSRRTHNRDTPVPQ